MKKIILIAVSCILVLAVCVIGINKYIDYKYGTPIQDVLNTNFSTVDKLFLRNGMDGSWGRVTDKKSIHKILDKLKNIRLKFQHDQSTLTSGYSHCMYLCKSGKTISCFQYSSNFITVITFGTGMTIKEYAASVDKVYKTSINIDASYIEKTAKMQPITTFPKNP